MPDGQIVPSVGAQVAHTKGQNDIDALQVSQVGAQVAYTGGEGIVTGEYVSQVVVQVAHTGGGALPVGVMLSQIGIQVAYREVLAGAGTGYAPRILVDMLFISGIERFTTEDTYVEEV